MIVPRPTLCIAVVSELITQFHFNFLGKGNLDQVRNVLRKSTKTRCISSEMLDSLEEAISNFYQLSNGRAFAGFEYPMNGLIAPVEPLIEQRFKKTIENDPIKRGQFMFYGQFRNKN